MSSTDPGQPGIGGYPPPPPGGFPPPPQGGYAPPSHHPYGAPPPGYPPPYGYPAKSKRGLWIGLGVAAITIVGAALYFFINMSDPAAYERGYASAKQAILNSPAATPAPASVTPAASAPVSTSIDSRYISGDWCDDTGGKMAFFPMGGGEAGSVRMHAPDGTVRNQAPYTLYPDRVSIVTNDNQRFDIGLRRVSQDLMVATMSGRPPGNLRRC